MGNQRTIKSLFATLFALLFLCTSVLAGCSSANVPSSAGTQTTGPVQEQPSAVESEPTDDINYVSIDINPSISLTVQYGVVFAAAAYNDDASGILLSVNVVGMTAEEAVAALINTFASEGYISADNQDAAIVITVHGQNEQELVTSLEGAASASLEGLGITCDVVASAVEFEIAQEAEAVGMTPGKYMIVQYLAEQDGISFEEARALYADLSMKELLQMVSDVSGVFGEDAYVFLAGTVAGLTPEQLALLNAALADYKAAMKAAVKTYLQAKEDARDYFHTARDEAHEAFKATGDHEAWQSAKTAAKNEMERLYGVAKAAFKEAKVQATNVFVVAIAGLGLTDDQIAVLLEWNFDLDWDDTDWDESEDADEGEDIDEDDADEDEDTDGDDEQEPDSGHPDGGNHGNGHGNEHD